MNKYRIQMAGVGADCFVFPVNKTQFDRLKKAKVDDQSEDMDSEDILDMINASHFADSGSGPSGLYTDPECRSIEVLDEDDNEIMVLDHKWRLKYHDKAKDLKKLCKSKQRYLIFEDSMQGGFQYYDLKIKGDFDPKKLTVIVSDIGGKIKLITGLRYNGRKLKVAEFGDGRGKGMYVHLI